MKKLSIFIAFISFIFILAYIMFFTPTGNSILKTYIESKINEKLEKEVKLTNFTLTPSKIDILINLDKDSFIKIFGNYSIFSKNIDIKYLVNISDLSIFKKLTKTELKGALKTDGKIYGNIDLINIDGFTNIADSNTKYKIVIKDKKPKDAEIDINSAKLSKILYMLNLPTYAYANVDLNIDLDNFDLKNLSGKSILNIKDGKTNPKILEKEFNLTNAKISFNLISNSDIKKSIAKSDVKLNSSIGNVFMPNMKFDINKEILSSKFIINIPNLDRLYFLTKKHLKGGAKIVGNIKKDKDLIVNAYSNILGGRIDIKLNNNNLKSSLKGVKATELSNMLLYPKIFDSTMNADIKYNLKTKKGILNARFLNGKILPNQMTFLLNQMAKFDITKEIYKETILNSKIDNLKIVSNLDMKSRFTHISSKNAFLDLKKDFVDAKLKIDIKDRSVFVKIKGDIYKPKIGVDAKEILKEKLEKKIDKKIPKKYQEPLKEILKLF